MQQPISSNEFTIVNGKLEQSAFPAPKQSANTLFNFMKQIKYLKKILRNFAIIPRYVNEDISYLGLETDNLAIPMTCFCDINMQRIEWHTKTYGKYGIAFHKDWSIRQGIQPIHYINPNSFLLREYKGTFVGAEKYDGADPEVENLRDYLLCHLAFMKPLYRYDEQGSSSYQNFHDEREWRYVPNMADISSDLPQILWGHHNNSVSRENCNKGLEKCPSSWLKFECKDIRYILLPHEEALESIVKYICSLKKISEDEKYILCSKLICLNSLEEDI